MMHDVTLYKYTVRIQDLAPQHRYPHQHRIRIQGSGSGWGQGGWLEEDDCRRLEVDKVDEGPCQLQQSAPTAARRWLWLLCGSPPPPSMDKPSCLPQEIPFCNAPTLFRKNSYTTHLWSLILILEGISLLVYSPALSICFGVICLPLIIMGRYYFSPAVFLYACAFGLPFVTHKISWPSYYSFRDIKKAARITTGNSLKCYIA